MNQLGALYWKDYITLALAVLGAVLGVMNTWNAMSQRRLRLKVRPSHAVAIGTGANAFCIEVVNLSTFPVTIAEVGLLFGSSLFQGERPERMVVTSPIIIDGGSWPRRLEARQSVSVYFDPRTIGHPHKPLGKAYALTACGELVSGDSPALAQLREVFKP